MGRKPASMDPQTKGERPSVLIPLKVLERESIQEGVPELLQNAHVVLLGYHVVPDQTSTSQASDQFEDKASSRLDDLTAILEDAGATVESKLVFTHDGQTTVDRVTEEEEDALAVLIPNSTRTIENVLVPSAASSALIGSFDWFRGSSRRPTTKDLPRAFGRSSRAKETHPQRSILHCSTSRKGTKPTKTWRCCLTASRIDSRRKDSHRTRSTRESHVARIRKTQSSMRPTTTM